LNTDILLPLEYCLGTIISLTGLDSLLRYIRRTKVTILMYHSVTPDCSGSDTCLSLAGMSTSVTRFRKHMEHVSKKYNTISLSDLVDWRLGKKTLPDNPCIITFDDGLKNVYENAVPVLLELKLKATFFVIGKTLNNSPNVWPYDLYTLIDSAPAADCSHAFESEIRNFPLTGQASKARIYAWARNYLGGIRQDERSQLLEQLRYRFNSNCLQSVSFMTPHEVRQLTMRGFQVGSHSMSHERLSKLDDSQLEKDVSDSRRIISRVISKSPIGFCYPFGGVDSWDKRVVEVLKKNGFLYAVSTIEGLNGRNTDLFSLRRVRVTGNLPVSAFVFRLLGLRSWLWWFQINYKKLKTILKNAKT
jgi:peptidoglycan/xylan/chitin deacetylase (PgdA/CDA1 family)